LFVGSKRKAKELSKDGRQNADPQLLARVQALEDKVKFQARELETKDIEYRLLYATLSSSGKKPARDDIEMSEQPVQPKVRQPNTIVNAKKGFLDDHAGELDVDSDYGR
jgi:hypothetical protein